MNTITLPRVDWHLIEVVLEAYILEYNLEGGSISVILDNIKNQLDKQEY